jgi:hypothetical protein
MNGTTVDMNWSTVDMNWNTVDMNWNTVDMNWSTVDMNWSTVDMNWSTVDMNWSTVDMIGRFAKSQVERWDAGGGVRFTRPGGRTHPVRASSTSRVQQAQRPCSTSPTIHSPAWVDVRVWGGARPVS